MRSRFAFLFFSLALAAQAAPLTRELGNGLVLQRLKALPADLASAEKEGARRQPTVLDLRYVPGDTEAAAALQTWLRGHAAQRTPVFVLANAKTSGAILAVLAAKTLPAHTVVVGVPSPGFAPDIAVTDTAENERKAYDALEGGTEVGLLLTENADKTRNDEASLAKPRLGESEGEGAAKAQPPVQLDMALQRAVHLHRALVALKKL